VLIVPRINTGVYVRTNLMTCLLTAALVSGCATGYGTLAAAGAGAFLGTVGTIASSARGEQVDGTLIAEGAAAGALFGVVGAAVAAAIAGKESRHEETGKKSDEARIRALEEALERRRSADATSAQ